MDSTWAEVKGKKRAVIPIGSIEQHGPHLPLSTDTLIAEDVSRELANNLNAVVAPTLTLGVSVEHMDFPGTISLTEECLIETIVEVCISLKAHGFREIILVNGHGGNSKAISKLKIAGVSYIDVVRQIKGYDHAGEIETSLMLYLHPEKVRKKKIRKHRFIFPGKVEWRTIDYSKSGVLGDPTKATAEKGKKYFNQIISGIMEELKK
ncbi:MAG: creatininase family protein [Candidatus Altiarchaeota archaeon]